MILPYQPVIIRTEQGLTIKGTRLTLYQVMDSLNYGTPPEEIMLYYNLTILEYEEIIKYIATHREEVEQEYHQVLALAESQRRYWEEHQKEKLKNLAPNPRFLAAKRQIDAWKQTQAI